MAANKSKFGNDTFIGKRVLVALYIEGMEKQSLENKT
jgi:hypothetical protein